MTPSSDAPTPGANGEIQAGRYYGRGVPYLPINEYPGKLIAIEGTDGVGRTTQIQRLREWLEVKGYGVIETGWTRSMLMQPTIELAKSSNTLSAVSLSRSPPTCGPAREGDHPRARPFVVLPTVHLHRAGGWAFGASTPWLLMASHCPARPLPEGRLSRRWSPSARARGMDFWESGMDLKLGDIYTAFAPTKPVASDGSMADEFHFARWTRVARRSHQDGALRKRSRRVPGRNTEFTLLKQLGNGRDRVRYLLQGRRDRRLDKFAPARISNRLAAKIDVAGLNFYYGAARVLHDVNLRSANQVTALIGPSGCGNRRSCDR